MLAQRPKVFLHIGTPKTGTTFIQGIAGTNSGRLRDAGLLFPTPWVKQVYAVRDVLGHSRGKPELTEKTAGAWDRLAEEVADYRGGASLVSMEWLTPASAKHARRIVESFPDADVHVIITVRDTAATMPGQWQSRIRNGETLAWQRYVRGAMGRTDAGRRATPEDGAPQGGTTPPDGVTGSRRAGVTPQPGGPASSGRGTRKGDGRPARRVRQSRGRRLFLHTHSVGRMLEIWTAILPAQQVHVVTVPPTGSDPYLLWHRFAEVLGLDPAVAADQPPHSNPSLGLASVELLRRVNVHLVDAPADAYHRTVSRFLAVDVLGPHSRSEPALRLHRAGRRFAARWNRKVRRAIAASGVHVVGDLADLADAVPDDPQVVPERLEQPTGEQLMAAAAAAEEALRSRLADRGVDVAGMPAESTADPVDAAVERIAQLARIDMELPADRPAIGHRPRGDAEPVGRQPRGPRRAHGRHRARRRRRRRLGRQAGPIHVDRTADEPATDAPADEPATDSASGH